MTTEIRVFPNLYRDSVTLMQVSATIAGREGVSQAQAVMASPGNLDTLRTAGLLEGGDDYGSGDLLVVVEGEPAAVAEALADAPSLLFRDQSSRESARERIAPRSIEMALGERPGGNLALISTPGEYAAAEARKALSLGLNVMMFSDNVEIEDERELKQLAENRGLLMMGPDCGTAIIDGAPLGFANVVNRGPIGVVGASGTGLQQVTCLIDRRGQGISQAIGTGGRDLKSAVGGVSMLRGLAALDADSDTRVIVLVSKPPARDVADRIIEAAARIDRPVVVNFLGSNLEDRVDEGIYAAATLDEAAARAVALAAGLDASGATPTDILDVESHLPAIKLAPGQRYVRGLFSGGTFCYESMLLLFAAGSPAWSNTPVDAAFDIGDPWKSRENTVIDLGDDVFTRGRPHPMIDLSLRNERLVKEAADPEVAVVLFDVVLGYGAHPDPAAEMVPAILAARERAAGDGREIAFVASVCGTRGDIQGLERQESALREAGVILTDSNAAAARMAARIINRQAPDVHLAHRGKTQ